MAVGVTKELTQFTGKVGRCEKDHVVELLSNGYGFCADVSWLRFGTRKFKNINENW